MRFAVAREGLPRLYFLVCTGPAIPAERGETGFQQKVQGWFSKS